MAADKPYTLNYNLPFSSGLIGNNVDAVDTVFAALKGFSPGDCVGAKHVGLGGLCLSLDKETTISSARSFEFLFYTIFYKRYFTVYTEQK